MIAMCPVPLPGFDLVRRCVSIPLGRVSVAVSTMRRLGSPSRRQTRCPQHKVTVSHDAAGTAPHQCSLQDRHGHGLELSHQCDTCIKRAA